MPQDRYRLHDALALTTFNRLASATIVAIVTKWRFYQVPQYTYNVHVFVS
jgi:hypothetical protein